MNVATIEGVIENGQIRLLDGATLPERTRVLVVVPNLRAAPVARVRSPRLVHPEQAADFVKELIEVPADARL